MTNTNKADVGPTNRHYINIMRGASILRVVLAHLGLSWFFMPYSSYIGAFLPLLFFVSGAVSYFSYLRARSTVSFLYKRMLGLLVPYYVLAALTIAFGLVLIKGWTIQSWFGWFVIAPSTQGLPFELGQVWFLQTLALITIMTLPVYYFATSYKKILIAAWLMSLGVIVGNSVWSLHSGLILLEKIDVYLAVSNAFFFLSGSLYYIYEEKLKTGWLALVSMLSLLLGLVINAQTADFSLGRHMASPDIVYVLCAMGVVGLVLAAKTPVLFLLDKAKPVEKLLIFSSTHAYAIFLLHTLVLGFVEKYIFTTPLTDDIIGAMMRLLLVLILTLIIAPFFTRLTATVANKLKSFDVLLVKSKNMPSNLA